MLITIPCSLSHVPRNEKEIKEIKKGRVCSNVSKRTKDSRAEGVGAGASVLVHDSSVKPLPFLVLHA